MALTEREGHDDDESNIASNIILKDPIFTNNSPFLPQLYSNVNFFYALEWTLSDFYGETTPCQHIHILVVSKVTH